MPEESKKVIVSEEIKVTQGVEDKMRDAKSSFPIDTLASTNDVARTDFAQDPEGIQKPLEVRYMQYSSSVRHRKSCSCTLAAVEKKSNRKKEKK